MSDSLVERLRQASVGMGTRNPKDYCFILTVAEAIEAADRIEELEAVLKALKATEAETPERPSTTVRTPLPSNETATDFVPQADFQAHRRHTAIDHQAQSERNLWVTDRLEDQERRIRTLEARISEAYQPREGLDPNVSTPASHGSEDKTPEPQHLEGEDLHRFQASPLGTAPLPKDRRSGKERRVLRSVEVEDGVYSAAGTFLYLNRRKSARRLEDRT